MSLIDEALRRARQEAARQDSAKREAQYRQVPVYAPPERNARPTLIATIVAVCVIAGIGIGVFLGRGREGNTEDVRLAEAVESSTPLPVVPESTEPPEPVTMPAPARETPSEQQQVPAAAAEPLQPPPVLDVPPAPAPEVVVPTPEPSPPAQPPVQATPEPTPEIRTYVREVPLPDGGTLRLSGIAFSAAQPVALINDRVLAKGESYEGFVVADIQANLVELRGNGMTVRVTLK